ncbi:MAG: DUF4150 domain-containing protein [Desulfobacteraceae bacterium]|nr:DUF4150 domain-containing protein [Desulfobacteraceae bacterium]
MGNNVFANGRGIACKAADGKSVAAFPDVAFTPPQTPATPPGVPIPYPNTAFAKDTTKGSKSVKISKKEVMLKNKSYFKKSTGDEAGRAPKKGLITGKITGKVYFNSWSMDVKIEGKNVVRHLDLTTHNHGSVPGNSPPWSYVSEMSAKQITNCNDLIDKVDKNCGEAIGENTYPTGRVNRKGAMKAMCEDEKSGCVEASKCMLVKYGGSGSPNCCSGKTGHHMIPVHCFMPPSARTSGGKPYDNWPEYKDKNAPTVCVEGGSKTGQHGKLHDLFDAVEDSHLEDGKAGSWSYQEARDTAAEVLNETRGCDEKCIKAQLDAYHGKACKDKSKLEQNGVRADSTGKRTEKDFIPDISGPPTKKAKIT